MIVTRAKAQEAKFRAAIDNGPDGTMRAAQKKLMARAEWEPFKAEFSRMIAGLNSAIEEGGLELRVTVANDPMGCGRMCVALSRRLGGPSGEQILFTVEPSGTVSVSYKDTRRPAAASYHLETLESPMKDFREAVIRFLLTATEPDP
ncbi:hypothetical protein ACRAWG_12280 [Methylobacterium sp. P31]